MDMQETESRKFFKDSISLGQLIQNGTTFEVNTDFNEPDDTFLDELNAGSDNEDDETPPIEGLLSPWTQSFAELKKQMQQINANIYKLISRPSKLGGELVSNNARVCIRYNAYWEGESAPFDSSYLRGSQHNFYTGCNNVLPGLEQAVLTMQVKEEAQFLISNELLFGKMGCPPRIKPESDGLFIIELVSFNDIGDIDADLKVAPEDRNKYNKIIDEIRKIHLKGLDFFKQSQFKNAARSFEKAVDCLNYCQLANEKEQLEQQAFLLKLHTNLLVCYNKTNQPGKTCIVMKDVRRLTNNKPSCKCLYNEGRALIMLGEYTRARVLLKKALSMEPADKNINEQLKILDEIHSKYNEDTKNMWTKAIGIIKNNENKQKENSVSKEFENEAYKLVESFKENVNITELDLPTGLTTHEVDLIDDLAKRMELKLRVVHGNITSYSLVKSEFS